MQPLSVSQFLEFLNTALTTAVFPEGASIEGEVVEYRVSQGKWIWFKMKDAGAVVDCFATVWQLRTPLEDGMQIRAHGMPKVHPKSGKFSFNVERVELVGEGALRRAFELLKRKLEAEGIFSVERKRMLPKFPRRIGLVASKESAAYGDFMRILGNRWGGLEVVVANVAVQGRDAVAEITSAFRWFNANPHTVDVLVLTRGGGAMEDLQAFNSEEVAKAVFSSVVPVIVGVGHERDETLADYAADVRASTPSNAAERLVPDRRELLAVIDAGTRRMDSSLREGLARKMQSVDLMAERIETHARRGIDRFAHLLKDFAHRFETFSADLRERDSAMKTLTARLATGTRYWAQHLTHKLESKEKLLKMLDPMRPLEKGYALVTTAEGKILTEASKAPRGEKLHLQLRKGKLEAEVTS